MSDAAPGPNMERDVAPYRLLEQIGSGGMGEVFKADDRRLGRRVAIKRIRPDRRQGRDITERLRREARFAAGLNHPAIVQVFDVLERDPSLYLVMEWVDGENLGRRLRRDGPLPIFDAIDIAQQVAAGLDAAHRRGIVHRDLKVENVLVDKAGRAKITDFGIAKRLTSGGGDTSIDETLTDGEGVFGTFRTLAPERALGEPASPSSDLFSLGVLLYEVLTGASPFGDANTVATLHRIVDGQPTPLLDLRDDVPAELAALVNRLLHKEPALRPRTAREVELDLAGVAGERRGSSTPGSGHTPPRGPGLNDPTALAPAPPIATSPTAPAAASPEARTRPGTATEPAPSPQPPRRRWIATVGATLAAAVALGLWTWGPWRGSAPDVIDLAGAAGIAQADSTEAVLTAAPTYVTAARPTVRAQPGRPGAPGDAPPPAALLFGDAVRVGVVRTLIGLETLSPKATTDRDDRAGDPLDVGRAVAADEVITADVFWESETARVTLSRLRVSDGVVLWSDAFEAFTEDLTLTLRAVHSLMRAAYPDRLPRATMPGVDVSPADLRRFLELRRRFAARADPAGADTLADLQALRATSPDFVDIDLQIAEVALYRFYDSRDPQHLETAERSMERAGRLAAGDPRVLRHRFYVDLEAGRLDDARATLDRMADLMPGDLQLEELRSRLLRRRGQASEALGLLRRVTDRRPSVKRLVSLARLEIDLGEIPEARRHLRDAMARSPESFEALSLLAQLELTVGDPMAAAGLYGQLVDRVGGTSELSNLGLATMLLGRYEAAAEHFARAVEIEPRNPFFLLNLADALWLADDRPAALAHYRGVVHRIEQDIAADRPQFLTVKAQALAHLGQSTRAVATLQQALARAPESGSVAYEAALVYALIGEDTSALVQAEAALRRGVEPRWFSFPWFDALRERIEFSALMGG
ncbi:MAG: protein kinase [Acidobacteriota bacterium]